MKRALLILVALLCVGCDSCRCHSNHLHVTYYEAYDSQEEICSGYGDDEICIPYWEHHPARCAVSFPCDVWCKDIDKGKIEAHPEHHTLANAPVVDPRCTEFGEVK